ncbi:MAG: hypothetical protein N2C14_04510 [Planctomycetales bacterium]
MQRVNRRDPDKERFWRRIVRRQPKSGLGVRAFCKKQEVTEASFYAWRREIALRDRENNLDSNSMDTGKGKNDSKRTTNFRSKSSETKRDAETRQQRNGCQHDPFPDDRNTADFLSLKVIPSPVPAAELLEIHLPRGSRIRVPAGFDPTTLAEVLRLLERDAC